MENRWSDRKMLELGVEIYKAGDKLLDCVSRDIGLGGTYLFIDSELVNYTSENTESESSDTEIHALTNDITTIEADSDVELVFHTNEGAAATRYYLHAKIVRVTESGIGLKFHDFDTSVFRSLQELLNYKYKQQRAVH